MSLSIQYETAHDAEMRLANTVVLYDGMPHYVNRVEEVGGDDIFRVHCTPLPLKPEAKSIRKFISSKKFDMAPFPLGFVNLPTGCVYVSRQPRRQQQQGLSSRNADLFTLGSFDPVGRDFNTMLRGQPFFDMTQGKYPSFREAVRKLANKETQACAFDRNFALVLDEALDCLVYLYYKDQKVGFFQETKLKIRKKSLCLKEVLQEKGVPVDV